MTVETGIGNKQAPKMQAIHGNQALLIDSLAAAEVRPEEVDFVINTHLHFDHCGWITTLNPDGSLTPNFPNARYLAHRSEVEHAYLQLDRDRISYLCPNYDPLVASGQMTLLNQSFAEVCPGVSVELYPGHTASMLAVHIESAGQNACHIGDLIPTTAHLDPTWVMGYDLYPLTCIAERKRFLERANPEQWLSCSHTTITPQWPASPSTIRASPSSAVELVENHAAKWGSRAACCISATDSTRQSRRVRPGPP